MLMKDSFLKDIFHTIKKYQMLEPGEKVLIGFSGGPDSMALLSALHNMQDMLQIKIYALHINHQLRPKVALHDEKFALRVCKEMKVLIKTRRIDVKQYAKKHKMSIEEAARSLRYNELLKVAEKLKCHKIALGHNANDNVETVIFNLCRGAGLVGLAGIPPVRTNIIRPLIETNRDDIIKYLKEHRLKYCYDLTNIELGYRRNYIRHKIVPMFLDINPNLIKTISRTSEILRDMNNDIFTMTAIARKDATLRSTPTRIELDTKKLLSYNILIKREIIKTMLPRLDFNSVNKVMTLIQKPAGKSVDLAKNYVAWKEYDKIIITRKDKQANISEQIWSADINKETKIPELNLVFVVKERKPDKALNNKLINDQNYALFDKRAIALPLSIRLRKTADRFTPFKGTEMKLKDVLINDKIPQRARDRLPLLCDQYNILWIIGSRRSNIGLINKKTKEIIEVKITKWQNNQ